MVVARALPHPAKRQKKLTRRVELHTCNDTELQLPNNSIPATDSSAFLEKSRKWSPRNPQLLFQTPQMKTSLLSNKMSWTNMSASQRTWRKSARLPLFGPVMEVLLIKYCPASKPPRHNGRQTYSGNPGWVETIGAQDEFGVHFVEG